MNALHLKYMRYKEYNKNKVLEQAIRLFWQKGFNGSSINDVVKVTGVNRFSLYHEFGNKDGILYASLELYRDRYSNHKLNILDAEGDAKELLKQFYLSFLNDKDPVEGCYFIHVGTELADTDVRVKKSLDNYLKDIVDHIQSLLIRNGYTYKANQYAKQFSFFFCTVMSFCLIHSKEKREQYVSDGINVIMSKYAKSSQSII